jgi:ATP-dependent protease ClpP protease subunit
VTRDPRRLRALAELEVEQPREWFHIGPARAEVVGEQSGDGGTERKTADVYIFDAIGGWSGTTATSFVRDVAALDVDHIDLHLNSPGGNAMDGVAIANVLRQHRADVTVWVDGMAASAASVIAMAGDEVVMGIGSQLMIHDASGYAFGPASEMRKAAEMLDSTSNAYASAYAAKAGGPRPSGAPSWSRRPGTPARRPWPRSWPTGSPPTDDNGRASGEQVVPGSSTPSFWDMWDSLASADRHTETVRALFAYAGRAEAPAPRMPNRPAPKTPAASAGGSTPTQEDDDMSHLTEGLRQRLGIAENADEGTILAALDEALAERATDEPPKAALPEGAVAIDAGILAELRTDAAAGREAREQQQAERREGSSRRPCARAGSPGRTPTAGATSSRSRGRRRRPTCSPSPRASSP